MHCAELLIWRFGVGGYRDRRRRIDENIGRRRRRRSAISTKEPMGMRRLGRNLRSSKSTSLMRAAKRADVAGNQSSIHFLPAAPAGFAGLSCYLAPLFGRELRHARLRSLSTALTALLAEKRQRILRKFLCHY